MTPGLTAVENLLRALRHEAPDHVPYEGEGAWRIVDHRGRKPPREGRDEWGVEWAPIPDDYRAGADEPLESYAAGPVAERASDLRPDAFPDGRDPALFDGILDGVDPARVLVIGRHGAGPLDRLCALLGMPGALAAMLMEPDETGAALERIADYHVAIARGYLAAGVRAGFLADDYAGGEGPYLRPAVWRRMILPGLSRIIAVYRDAGAPVLFHTCGRAEALIGDLIEAGVTGFNLQTDACDLAGLKACFGRRIGFYGGISSSLMQAGGPDEIEEAARRAMAALGADGGLMLAPDQPLDYPAENLGALARAARRFGRYPLRLGV
jgi:uroporphyrinogen decarboxylase